MRKYCLACNTLYEGFSARLAANPSTGSVGSKFCPNCGSNNTALAFPLAGGSEEYAYSLKRRSHPKKGEYYLSGASRGITEAYKAPNDLSTVHYLAELIL